MGLPASYRIKILSMTSKAQVLGSYHSPMTWVLIFFPTPHCSATLLPGCTQNTIVFQASAGFELLILLPGSGGISSMYNHTRYVTCL